MLRAIARNQEVEIPRTQNQKSIDSLVGPGLFVYIKKSDQRWLNSLEHAKN